ncbi:hypothetical protein OIU84_010132 [Salix udensis]|uniref:WRKY domain-containing protein n=1 Tax=Salix udensis TaxID=889485 RepID=A0AAD6JM52_9ROSI|nr:hypothetical protein OIU84_010132 [Salix udensis]
MLRPAIKPPGHEVSTSKFPATPHEGHNEAANTGSQSLKTLANSIILNIQADRSGDQETSDHLILYTEMSSPNFSTVQQDTPELISDYARDQLTNFELSEFLTFDEWTELDDAPSSVASGYAGNPVYRARVVGESGESSCPREEPSGGEDEEGREKKEAKERVAFKTRSEIEILDDGYKWRKYGKKMVKNNANPRNYYRCSIEGCPVKKRVERDRDDPGYVITTYEGIHTHHSFFLILK